MPFNVVYTIYITATVAVLQGYAMLLHGRDYESLVQLNKALKDDILPVHDEEIEVFGKVRESLLERFVFYFLVALSPVLLYTYAYEFSQTIDLRLKLLYTLFQFAVDLALVCLSFASSRKLHAWKGRRFTDVLAQTKG